ncbi:MAG TPA: hypothetical protein VGS21_08880, partial [Acidimicrobiales bacterium]|nr:hypothetical protein [Acidimicrobiales bacterium]
GSTGNIHLNESIIEMEALPSGTGYRFVAADGGVFDFGAKYDGSLGGTTITSPAAGMAATPSGAGYWLVQANGVVTGYGGATTYP